MRQVDTLEDLLKHVSTCVRQKGSDDIFQSVGIYSEAFDNLPPPEGARDINIFTYHVDVPDSERFISYVDVEHDHHAFDYVSIADHMIRASLNFHPNAQIYYVTSADLPGPAPHPHVSVVRLPVDKAEPMHERVKAMAAYVRSKAFTRNTVFLDTDAFPNANLSEVFDQTFDIGVTERPTEGFFMPLNEGVVMASADRPDAVVRFFDSYIATYECLLSDEIVTNYYGNIKRWRGGQLSLNAVAAPPPGAIALPDVGQVSIKSFPCETHNFWVRSDTIDQPRLWGDKLVLHLKGDSKSLLSRFLTSHRQSISPQFVALKA